MDHDKGEDAREWRTSHTYWLASSADPQLAIIDEQVSNMTHTPVSHQEPAQIWPLSASIIS